MESTYNKPKKSKKNRKHHRKQKVQEVPKLRPVEFINVGDLEPEQRCVSLKVIVITAAQEYKDLWMALVGDESGCAKMIIPLNLVPEIQVGTSLFFRNGYVEMMEQKYMRLTTNEWGKIEIYPQGFGFHPNTRNNISTVEYQLES